MLLTSFNNTQQQHNDMPQNFDIIGEQYIEMHIVNVCTHHSQPHDIGCLPPGCEIIPFLVGL